MTSRIVKFFASLRLTVALLALGILLVFVGTIAQADEGLYQAQQRYFKQWVVFGITFLGWRIPVPLPGGYLLGTALLVNLVTAHATRFQWKWRKLGIHLTHAGVILLLVGQLATDMFSRETEMHFAEGETRNYTENSRSYELAFVADADASTQRVVAIPEALLARGGELAHPDLPFKVRVKSFWPNSEPAFRAPMMQNGPPLAPNGIAKYFDFRRVQETQSADARNVPTAVVEIEGPGGTLGTWVASGWSGDETMVGAVRTSYAQDMGPAMARQIAAHLTDPQTVSAGGRTWSFLMRPARVYQPFSLTLQKTTHQVYPGTDIPKDFRSRVRIGNPQSGENREVEIYMNSPLRYGGLTFYQFQMGRDDVVFNRGTSTLQVVRNPSWLTPYAACLLVGLGMVIQFMLHLGKFVSRRKAT